MSKRRKKYFYCFVPLCKSTTKSTPNKRFLCVPKDQKIRKLWWVAAHRAFPMLRYDCYCCEDHFNLEEDIENYLYVRMMGGNCRMKAGVVPHKFQCQGRQKPQNENRMALARKRKLLEIFEHEEILQAKKPPIKSETTVNLEELEPYERFMRKWVKGEDIETKPLPDYIHPRPDVIQTPIEYFSQFFDQELVNHIVFQTNLYANQGKRSSTLVLDASELCTFVSLVLYMGVCQLPFTHDYWAIRTRVPQVADFMSKNRFLQIKTMLHFNNNRKAKFNTDRFYKIRPFFTKICKSFYQVPATPVNSIDEVMVMCKRMDQYAVIQPDKSRLKLFCRASEDGFIHDIMLYQGKTTFSSHHTQLSEAEKRMKLNTKVVVALVKTIQEPCKSAIYADNFFTSIELVEYLRSKYSCRYVGTGRETCMGYPPLKDMDKNHVPMGELDYYSYDGILAARWKNTKSVTILSSDVGINPISLIERYDSNRPKKDKVSCPDVVKKYSSRVGGVEKSTIHTNQYKSSMRAKTYYLKLFYYILEIMICNAWILYKRDCKTLDVTPLPLKEFRLDVSNSLKSQEDKTSGSKETLGMFQQQDATANLHLPIKMTVRESCKHCSCDKESHVKWMCESCEVALCLTEQKNCFEAFHKNLVSEN